MDKNTITGLVLMAAVMFGFLWLSKPSEADIAAENARREQAQAAKTTTDTPDIVLTPADSAALVAGVRSMGTKAEDGRVVFTNSNFNLNIDSLGTLAGTYTDGTNTVDINDLTGGRAHLDAAALATAYRHVRELSANAAKYAGFAKYLGGEAQDVVLENELVKVTLTSRGAMVDQVELKKFNTEVGGDTAKVNLFRDATDGYGFRFLTTDQRLDTRDFNLTTTLEGDSAVYFAMAPAAGAEWGIRYTLAKDGYTVRMDIIQNGIQAVIPASTATMDFYWHQKMGRNELGRTFEERNSAIYYDYIGGDVDDLNANDDDSESVTGRLRWVAFKNQFFSSVIIARDSFGNAELSSLNIKTADYLKDMSMTATIPYTINNGTAASFDWYFGPNDYPILSDLDDTLGYDEDLELTRLIPLGWGLFRWINVLVVIPVFTFLGKFISSYGLIIFLLTLFIKLIIFPFTFKSYKSQAKMRVLAPEIKEINEKYPDQADALKRQQETMALYSRAGASPFSGCLPMLFQMPVLIAMFSFFPSAIELRGQSFLWAHDLSAPDTIFTLPFTIPFYGNHVSLFCLLMTIVNIVYMKVSMQSQPTSQGMPGMKAMMYIMPVMFLFIFNDYASGLSYYYFLSLLITIIQTWIFRRVIDEKKVREQLLANARKPRKKSGWMARLEEASRQAQQAQRQQQNAGKRRR